jgi:hypothetical protein
MAKSAARFKNVGPLLKLRNAIQKAIKGDAATVVLVDAGPGRTIGDVKSATRHELHHATETDWTPEKAQEFLDSNRAAGRAAEMLKQFKDVPDDPVILVSEIGAQLQGGPSQWKEIGVNDEAQAKALWKVYRANDPGLLRSKRIHPKLKVSE